MKRYKLLKDLPTFNKGDTFQLDEDSGCLVREKDGVVAYAPYTLEKFNILDSDWFEEIPEGKRWRAKKGGQYWWVQNDGWAAYDDEYGADIDDRRYELGNYFKTEEEAQKAANWLKAFTVLRDDTKGFKPDWADEDQKRWYVYYSLFNGEFYIVGYIDCHPSPIIFATKDDAQASIKNHEQEWRVFLNCGVEE